MVVDLLDYDVRFGQGFLFSPPRPVRAEALANRARHRRRSRTAAGETTGEYAAAAGASTWRDAASAMPRLSTAHECRCLRSSRIFRRCAPATTCCCATSGAWCITASRLPEACDALMRFRAGGGTVILITNAPRPGERWRASSNG